MLVSNDEKRPADTDHARPLVPAGRRGPPGGAVVLPLVAAAAGGAGRAHGARPVHPPLPPAGAPHQRVAWSPPAREGSVECVLVGTFN